MRDSWFFRIAGEESGPVSFESVIEFAQSGRIKPDDELRRGDQQFWQPASDVVGLFDHSAAVAGEDALFDDILQVAAVDDRGHRSGQRVGMLLEDQLGYDPHHPPPAPVKEPRYFCRLQGRESGPFTLPELQQRADEGLIAPHDRVRHEEGKAWVPAQELSGIRFPKSAASALKTRSISGVADAIAKQKPKPPPAPPKAKPKSMDDVIDEVLSRSEAERPAMAPVRSALQTERTAAAPRHIPEPDAPSVERAVAPDPPRPGVTPPAPSKPSFDPSRLAGAKKPKPPKQRRELKLPSLGKPAIYGGIAVVVLAAGYFVMTFFGGGPPVRGRASVDGQPVPLGAVSFIPETGTEGPAMNISILNGSFEAAADAQLGSGPYKVIVVIGNPLGNAPPEIAASSTFSTLNGATFEKSIDTSSGADDLFVLEFTSADAVKGSP